MHYPKVKFSIIPFAIEFKWMRGFLFFNKWGWEKRIIKRHPKLSEAVKTKSQKKKDAFLSQYILDFRRFNQSKLLRIIDKFRKEWQMAENSYFSVLSEILEISWPKNRKVIKALVSIDPICPRFLDDWSFSLFFGSKKKDMIETIMHEACHFLYFEKWRDTFQNAKRKTFDYPYIEWHLSEILAPVILSDKRIQKLLRKETIFYEEHKKIKIENVNVPDYFLKLYDDHIKMKSSFSGFLKVSYSAIKNNSKLFDF